MEAVNAWSELNKIMKFADEETCRKLLTAELTGPKRPTFANRIYSRLNRVRAARERKEIADAIQGKK